jgi:hypothetical protein
MSQYLTNFCMAVRSLNSTPGDIRETFLSTFWYLSVLRPLRYLIISFFVRHWDFYEFFLWGFHETMSSLMRYIWVFCEILRFLWVFSWGFYETLRLRWVLWWDIFEFFARHWDFYEFFCEDFMRHWVLWVFCEILRFLEIPWWGFYETTRLRLVFREIAVSFLWELKKLKNKFLRNYIFLRTFFSIF